MTLIHISVYTTVIIVHGYSLLFTDFIVGNEFDVAAQAAKLHNATVVLGDRNIYITLGRSKLGYDSYVNEEAWKYHVVTYERDLYMIYRLRKLIKAMEEEGSSDIVAVVG